MTIEMVNSAIPLPKERGYLRLPVRAVLLAAGALLATCYVSTAAMAAGPSFPCTPASRDALERLTCSDPTLANAELGMVQAY